MSNFEISIEDEHSPNEISNEVATEGQFSPSKEENYRANLIATADHPVFQKLNKNQLAFVHAIIENKMDIAKASEQVGYSRPHGYTLMQRQDIREAYTLLMNSQSFHTIMGYNEALSYASDVIRGKESDTIINPKTGETVQVPVLTRDRMKALEFVMKHNGIIKDGTPQLNINTDKNITIDIEGMDLELVKSWEERQKKDITNVATITEDSDIIDI
ncbi:hypothetical protein [Bacillus toyonensis]